MTDLTKLKELAERATPGPWSCNRHFAVVGGPVIQFANGSAQQQIAMAVGQSWMHCGEQNNNAAYIAAANPQAILGLIAEIEENESVINVWRGRTQRAEAEVERLKAENEALRTSLKALIHISDATGWEDHTCGEIAKARAALEGGGR